ncbi:MAG: InlB B-repeat-containing protein [Paludibacteraceae bacterium]|nr:InlB B-repeat-containing protein [Paludibacteraceae bacterium]
MNNIVKKLMLVALTVFSATGAWAGTQEGPWSYVEFRTGRYDKTNSSYYARSYEDLNKGWWDEPSQWGDSDGIGLTVEGKSGSKEKQCTYSIYRASVNVESFSRQRLNWTFKLGASKKQHNSITSLYGGFIYLDVLKNTKVDCTENYSDGSGSAYRLGDPFKHTTEGKAYSGETTRTFYFDNSNGTTAANKYNYLLLVHVITSGENGKSDLHEWGAFKNVSMTWDYDYYKRINFNGNGATSGSMDVQTIENSGNLNANAFSRTGYTFDGWATSATGGKVYNNQASISATSGDKGNVYLYAHWVANKYTVSFNQQSGTGGSGNITATYDANMPTVSVPTRAGYTFQGYFDAASGGTKYYNANGTSARTWNKTANTTLYAQWTIVNYTIGYTLNGGSVNGNPTSYNVETNTFTLKNPTRTGYTFKGWTGSNGSTAQTTVQIAKGSTGNKTYTANWTAGTYTVTLDRQGGEGGSGSVTATYAAAMPSMTKPTRTGYTFQGYFTEAKGAGTQYYNADGSSAKNWDKIAATTLYAYWTPVPYAITYNLEGGTDTGNPTSYTIETETFTLKAPVREDYTFLGWTGSNGEEVQLTVTIAKGSTEGKSYTAHWEANDAILQELHDALGEKAWTGYGVNTGVISYSRGDEPKEFRATIMGGTYTFDIPFRDVNSITKALNTDGSATYTLNVSLPAQTGMASETLRVTLKDGEITGMESENAGLEMSKEGAEITDWAALQTAMNNGGVIKLTADITATPADAALTVPAGKTVVLDLNGFTINRALTAPAANGSVIINNGTLAIQTTNGGKITGGKTTGNGGGILNNGVLTLYGGEITGNKASGMGGGVYNAAAAPAGFWMTGGLIDGNTAGSYAAIGGDVTFSNMAVVQVNAAGSTVSNATAKTGMVKYDYIQPVMPDLEKFGILSELYAALGNETWTGYGVNTGVISYSRGDEVNEFRATFMGGNYTLDVPFGDFTAASKAENTDGSFTYTLELPLPAYTGLSSETVKITIKDGEITGLQSENAGLDMNKEAGEITGWAALQAAVNNGGVIKLTTDVTATSADAALTVPAGKTVVIDLNGHTLNRALTAPTDNGSVIINNGTLAIMDNAGNGKITGGNTVTIGGGVLNNGAFTLYGGEITGNKAFDAGGGVYNTAEALPGGFWMTGGLIDGNTAGSFAAIGGKVTFNKQAAVQVDADGTVVDINTAAAHMMSYSYIRPALPSVDQMMTTPAQQANGAWQAYMPAGNRMLRVTYKDEPQLAWVDKDKQPVTAISGYHGFQPLVAIPNLNVSNTFRSALIAGTSAVEFFSSNPDIVSVAGSDFSINGVGEADLAAIHRNDADFKYDSAAFHVTVLAPDTMKLLTNNAEWGTVAAVTPLGDSVRAGEGNKFFAVPGATMIVQATPADGFHLRYWSNGAAVDAKLRAQAQVQGNTELLAFFAPDTVPAIVTKEPVVFDTLVYTGYAQTILTNGAAIGGQFKYSLDSATWSTDLPQIKDAGTHTFYCYVDSTDVLHRCLPVETHTVTIAKAPLTITAENKDTIYGEPAPAFTAAYTGLLGEDTVGVVSGLTMTSDYLVTSNVGEYAIVPANAQAANYTISYTNGTLTVNKAPLMITADDKEVIYGDEHPEFTASYSGWKNADDESVVSGLTFSTEYLVISNVGEYDIVPANATAQNYEISYTNGTLTVNKATLTVTAEDKTMIYGDEHPEFTASYSGWKNEDDESVVSDLDYTCAYAPGSYIGTYAITPHSAMAQNYEFEYKDGTLTVNKAVVKVSGAEAQIAKIESGTTDAVVLNAGTLDGIKLSDPIGHETTASFSDAAVGENKTITLYYTLTGDAALLANYDLIPTSEIFSVEGVIIEDFIPAEEGETEKENDEAQIEEGIEVYAYGYCLDDHVYMRYHLNRGNPDQYKIEFADNRFTDVNYGDYTISGPDGTIEINIPADMPTGDYTMTVTFRDSRFDWLESDPFTVTFHVNLPETYVMPQFNNVIALVDTCECFTDIQWYHRADASEAWQPIEGATGHYYRPADGSKLTGEFFVKAKMNGEPTYTCGQSDMETLYGADKQQPKATVKAYPNPVVNTTTVTIENSENWNHSLRIVNLMGIEVMNSTFEGNETTVDMDGFVQGNYMISVDGIVVKVMKK